jgi:hypothetical protein
VAAPTFFLLEPLTPSCKKRLGGLGLLPKNCSTKGEGFDPNFFGGELVEGKKMLF